MCSRRTPASIAPLPMGGAQRRHDGAKGRLEAGSVGQKSAPAVGGGVPSTGMQALALRGGGFVPFHSGKAARREGTKK
ncbi:MAG: hypothetical protein DBY06_00060 [Clostridiales bacterium]|nr:MAG: hypothetical protein DBY06_00060 [Clostridiales bacterium]